MPPKPRRRASTSRSRSRSPPRRQEPPPQPPPDGPAARDDAGALALAELFGDAGEPEPEAEDIGVEGFRPFAAGAPDALLAHLHLGDICTVLAANTTASTRRAALAPHLSAIEKDERLGGAGREMAVGLLQAAAQSPSREMTRGILVGYMLLMESRILAIAALGTEPSRALKAALIRHRGGIPDYNAAAVAAQLRASVPEDNLRGLTGGTPPAPRPGPSTRRTHPPGRANAPQGGGGWGWGSACSRHPPSSPRRRSAPAAPPARGPRTGRAAATDRKSVV